MKSKIYFDVDNGNNIIIKVDVLSNPSGGDISDKLVDRFIHGLGKQLLQIKYVSSKYANCSKEDTFNNFEISISTEDGR
jgi:hypothetical protein